jgi:hypothetical protein
MPPISAQGKEALLAAIRDGKGSSASILRAIHSTRRESISRHRSSRTHTSR